MNDKFFHKYVFKLEISFKVKNQHFYDFTHRKEW